VTRRSNKQKAKKLTFTVLLRALGRWRYRDEVVGEALRIGREEIVDAGEVRGADDEARVVPLLDAIGDLVVDIRRGIRRFLLGE
jgi:hypothetical protein